jgi:5-methylcytosine-specific restriction endonuclease McrA
MDAKWKQNNPQKAKEVAHKACRKHRLNNPEYYRKRAADYRSKNRARVNGGARASYKRRRIKIRAYQKQYNQEHKVERWLRSQKRRALKRAATVNLKAINAWVKFVKSQKLVRCYYCDVKLPPSQIHIDHVISLEKGGAHSVENLCVSCPPCNLSKNKHLIQSWYKAGQQILGI